MAFRIESGVLIKCTEEKGVTDIVIPDGVTSIGKEAFEWCRKITSIIIPDGVTSISEDAFHRCRSLESITIPDSITNIKEKFFFGCKSLKSINISEKNKNYSSCDGVLYNKDMTTLIKYPQAKPEKEFIIPESVIHIGEAAFRECSSLESLIIPDSVTNIGENAFRECSSLETLIIPDSVTNIGSSAFCECSNLKSITISDSVTNIGIWAFSYCENLESINVSEKNKNYSSCDGVLYDKDMATLLKYPQAKPEKEFIIPDGITNIGENAFSYCESLESITISDGVKNIGYGTFYGCSSLKNITIPDIVINISSYDFYDDTRITIYKGNIKASFTLKKRWKGYWNKNKSEEALNNFICADIEERQKYFSHLIPCYKIPLALFMAFAYPQESSCYLDSLRQNTEESVTYLIDEENIELIYKFLELGFVTEKNIDDLINHAIEHTQNGGSPEPQVILSDYKNTNFGTNGTDSFDKFFI